MSVAFQARRRLVIPALSMLAVLCAVLSAEPLAAQEARGSVLVRVTERATNAPMADVVVRVVGTQVSQVTNAAGQALLLNVPVGRQTVTTQRLGFGTTSDTVVVAAGQTAALAVTLNESAVQLEGLVVTGTATGAQRREIGNSMTVVTSEQIQKIGAQNFEDLLRGRALGVSVTGSSGTAGAGSDLTLRGVSSVNGRNDPLIYVDGVRLPSGLPEGSTGEAEEHASFLGSINPADIDRIEVIKGPAASALYGTEATAGVIQIFTKKGQAGPPRWTLNVSQGLSTIGHVGPSLDPTGLHVNDCTRQLTFDSTTYKFGILNERDPGCPSSGSWVRDAHVQKYNLSARGGAGDVTYYLSGGWDNTQGVVAPQGAKNLTLRGNFTFNGLRNLEITMSNMYSRRDIVWIPNGDQTEGLLYNVARGPFGETPGNNDAVVLDMELDQFINHFNSAANISWTPSASFRHRLNIGLDFSNSHYITEEPWLFWNNPEGSRTADVENQRVITFDYAGSWHRALPWNLTSTLSWGGQYNQGEHLGVRGDAFTFIGPGDKVLQNGEEFTAQEDRDVTESGGFMLQSQIGWRNRLFVTAGLRADTHSAFGSDYTVDQKFTMFPKLQAAYTISDHSFWPKWWETFRIRSAFGVSGDPPGVDDPVTYFQVAGTDENQLGFIIQNQGNPGIGPERATEWEYGLDGSLLNGRLAYELTGYQRKTTDGRIFVTPPSSNGIAESIPVNTGEWKARGFEGSIDVLALERDAFRLSLNAGYQWNRTEMVDLGSPEFANFSFNYLNQYRTGYPMPSLWDEKVINADSVGVLPIYSDTVEYFGPTRPPHELSLGTSLTLFDRLTIDAFGVGQYGHVLYDDLAQEMATEGLWPACFETNVRVEQFQAGNTNAIAGLTAGQIAKCSQDYATDGDWTESANYFRMQSVTANYRVPESILRFGFTQAVVTFQATNLFTITNFSGLYPDALIRPLEQTARGAGYILPPPRTYTLGFRLNF